MAKFNVGDKVKVISLGSKSSGYGVNIGMVGEVVVVEYGHDCECVGVKFTHEIDGNSLYHGGQEALGRDATNGLWIEPENLKLVEEDEESMEPPFKNMKIRIKDEAHSRLVQEALFETGYVWTVDGNKRAQGVNRHYMICEEGYIFNCGDDTA